MSDTTTSFATQSLTQAVEVWRPTEDGSSLALEMGAYGMFGDQAGGRLGRRCSLGEGLVGAAWQSKSPVLRTANEDAGDDFNGIPCSRAIAIPSICQSSGGASSENRESDCRGVVTLLLDDADNRQGAAEVWRPNERSELALVESWYANLERFGMVSGYVKFPRRAGLPGKVWNDRFPRVMGALGDSADFVRVAGAKTDGLSTALGIPFMRSAREIEAVLLLLSSSRTPLARVMEVWAPDRESNQLKVISADYGPYVDLAPTSRRRRLSAGEGIAGRVFEDRSPWLTTDLLGVEFPIGNALSEYRFEWGLGLPVFVGGELFAVVTLLN